MICAWTHLLGSDGGYRTLACAPGIGDEDLAALADVDLGQPCDLNTGPSVVYGRPLPSGRVAITRCFSGTRDDAGRPTLAFRTLILTRDDWLHRGRLSVSAIAEGPHWDERAFQDGQPLEISCPPPQPPSGDALAAAAMLEGGRRPMLMADEAATRSAVCQAVGLVAPALACSIHWGVGLCRIVPRVDLGTIAPVAPRRGVPLLPRSALVIRESALPPLQDAARPTESAPVLCDARRRHVWYWLPGVLVCAAAAAAAGWWLWQSAAPIPPAAPRDLTEVAAPPPASVPEAPSPPERTPVSDAPTPQPLPPVRPRPETPSELPTAPSPAIGAHAGPASPAEALVHLDHAVSEVDAFGSTPARLARAIQATCATLANPARQPDGSIDPAAFQSACDVFDLGPPLDDAWNVFGGVSPLQAWVSAKSTRVWIASLTGPPSARAAALTDRLHTVQRIRQVAASLVKVVRTLQDAWEGAGVEVSLQRIASEASASGADCSAVAEVWAIMPPDTRWPEPSHLDPAIESVTHILRTARDEWTKTGVP